MKQWMARSGFRLGVNPIIVKELRSRMRGPRAFITLTIVLLLTGGVLFGLLQLVLATSRYTTVLSPQLGQGMFAALAYLELFMICAITPAVTAGAISGEKEKQTYEMLMATPLSPARILWGKLISAMSYVLLLLFAAIPLASIVFIFGGVAPREMIKALVVLLVIAITVGILGLFMSALFGRTGWATVASYITVVLMTAAPIFIAVLVGVLRQSEPPRWILAPSPISALAAALAPSLSQSDSFFQLFYVLSGIWNIGISPISQTEIPRPLYHYSLPFYGSLSLVLYLMTMRLVQPTRRFRIRAREALVGAAILMVFCGLVAAAFLLTAGRYEWARANGLGFDPTPAPIMPPPVIAVEQQVVQIYPPPGGPTPTPLSRPTSTPAAPGEVTLNEEARAQIYAAVARQLYTVDHTFGDQPPNWPVIYLVQTTDDGVGDPNTPKEEPVTLDEATMQSISAALADLPAEIRWTASSDEVAKDPQTGQVEGNGVIVTFGNLHAQKDGSVHVPASLYFSGLGAAGKTYILEFIDGQWTITGTTGVEWTS